MRRFRRAFTVPMATLGLVAVLVLPGGAAAASTPVCSTRDLQITEHYPQGATGTWIFELSYRNITRSKCRTGGYPGITLYGIAGEKIGVAKMEPDTKSQSRTIVLGPGKTVYGMIAYPDHSPQAQQTKSCHRVAAVRIYAPNSTASVRRNLKEAGVACGSGAIFDYPLVVKSPLSGPKAA